MVLLSEIIQEGSTANWLYVLSHFRAGPDCWSINRYFQEGTANTRGPSSPHIAFAIFKNWPSLRGQISSRCFKLTRLTSFMQPGLQGDFFARFFLEKNPDVDFFSGAAYWPRKWFESSMKGQDPDCWQLEAEFSPLVFVCVFSSGLRGGKNELLKLYGWKSFFSSHIVEFGWCSFWCVLYVPKILRKLRALVVFFRGWL